MVARASGISVRGSGAADARRLARLVCAAWLAGTAVAAAVVVASPSPGREDAVPAVAESGSGVPQGIDSAAPLGPGRDAAPLAGRRWQGVQG